MQIIKDKKIIQDTWSYVEDGELLPDGDITVSLQRWLKDKATLVEHEGRLGVRLNSTDAIDSICNDLPHFKMIELYFAAFTDGRSFSQAWLLRNRYKFENDIRAVGHFMPDQLFYLHRVGVNTFRLSDNQDLPNTVNLLNDFTVSYQASTN